MFIGFMFALYRWWAPGLDLPGGGAEQTETRGRAGQGPPVLPLLCLSLLCSGCTNET